MSDIYGFLAFVFAIGLFVAVIIGHYDIAKFFFASFVAAGMLDTIGRVFIIFFGGRK